MYMFIYVFIWFSKMYLISINKCISVLALEKSIIYSYSTYLDVVYISSNGWVAMGINVRLHGSST